MGGANRNPRWADVIMAEQFISVIEISFRRVLCNGNTCTDKENFKGTKKHEKATGLELLTTSVACACEGASEAWQSAFIQWEKTGSHALKHGERKL